MTESFNHREAPQVDGRGFDARLLSLEKLYDLGAAFPLVLSEQGLPNVYLDCAECGRTVEVLTDRRGGRYRVKAGQLLANIVRHRVRQHGLSLSGGGDDAGTDTQDSQRPLQGHPRGEDVGQGHDQS